MSLRFTLLDDAPEGADVDTVVAGLHEDGFGPAAKALDAASGGVLRRLADSGDLVGRAGSVTRLFALPGVRAPRVHLVGLGERGKFDAARYGKAAAEAVKSLRGTPARAVAVYLPEHEVPGRDRAWRLRTAAIAAARESYRYAATLKQRPPEKLEHVAFHAPGTERALAEAEAIAAGIALARELGNLPPNVCTPAYFAEQAREIATKVPSTTVEVLEREQMAALGMGALLGVAQGSAHPPRLIVLRYSGAAAGERPYVLIGKGITFDSGGISIKPGASMEEMKFDMMGGATVLGAFLAAARLALPINLVAIVPAVENMPDGNAYRPGDVLRSMSGQTIEIVNTDAEGRLILCDALTYAQRFEPRAIVDVATLTGACVIALGKHAHGLFTREDTLAEELVAAGQATLDRAWRLPMWDDYQPQLDSVFADMANVGGKSAGAITAACFLARYTEGQRWAHLDIAGTAWDEGRKGTATGRPVPLLVQWLIDRAAG